MPQFDLPMDSLLAYSGQSSRPADFDAYWDTSLQDMESLGTRCTLEPAEFACSGAACYHLWFQGTGGARIHAKCVRPVHVPEPVPAVLLFHGYNRDSGSWSALLPYACAGMAVFALDCRGQAGLSDDCGCVRGSTVRGHVIRGVTDPDPKALLMRSIFLDTAQLARIAMAQPWVDPDRVAAAGGSQGGGLALACAALTPSLNRVAAMMPFLCDYRRAWQVANPDGAYGELSYYFRYMDPRHKKEDAFFERLGYIDNVNLAPRIRAPLLLMCGLLDRECPPSTQFAAYNAVTAPKRCEVWPDYGHEVNADMEDVCLSFLKEMTEEGVKTCG